MILKANVIDGSKSLIVSIIHENTSPHLRWDENIDNQLANQLFDLNRKAAKFQPDIVLWSETAIPWDYFPDDDLIKEAVRITYKSDAEHIIGIFQQAKEEAEKTHNSALLIDRNAMLVSSYHKTTLLSFLEKPFLHEEFKMPFFSESVYTNLKPGQNQDPLEGRHGLYGALICNEILNPYEARKMVTKGALLFLNLSNDSWGKDTHLVDWHFYASRVRAIENNRDIIINSNRGISGILHGNGDVEIQGISKYPQVLNGMVYLNESKTIFSRFGDWFIIFSFLYLLGLLVFMKLKK